MKIPAILLLSLLAPSALAGEVEPSDFDIPRRAPEHLLLQPTARSSQVVPSVPPRSSGLVASRPATSIGIGLGLLAVGTTGLVVNVMDEDTRQTVLSGVVGGVGLAFIIPASVKASRAKKLTSDTHSSRIHETGEVTFQQLESSSSGYHLGRVTVRAVFGGVCPTSGYILQDAHWSIFPLKEEGYTFDDACPIYTSVIGAVHESSPEVTESVRALQLNDLVEITGIMSDKVVMRATTSTGAFPWQNSLEIESITVVGDEAE